VREYSSKSRQDREKNFNEWKDLLHDAPICSHSNGEITHPAWTPREKQLDNGSEEKSGYAVKDRRGGPRGERKVFFSAKGSLSPKKRVNHRL